MSVMQSARSKYVMGNWKMMGTRASVTQLLSGIKATAHNLSCRLVVLPSFVYLPLTQTMLQDSPIAWGGQDVSTETQGAFTGEISASMLKEFGCQYALVGHSERRHLYHEDNVLCARKFQQVAQSGLIPIYCVGETLAEREQGKTEAIIRGQLDAVFALPEAKKLLAKTIIAYEPVWAIGTGVAASPEQAEEVHRFIRETIALFAESLYNATALLYGGSINPDNAARLFAMPNIDGGLVGGASLEAKQFLDIAACHSLS